ncbi:MAG: flagellar hook-basal body protein [Bacillota bacterium]
MLRGLYTATSAMLTNNRKLDVITNNLANVNTTGFKKDLVLTESFPEVLVHKINTPMASNEREAFRGVQIGQEDGGYQVTTTGGYFRVKTVSGVSYQKSLNFAVNEDGYLSTYNKDAKGNIDTSAGYLVLGNNGPIYAGNQQVTVNEQGQVLVGGNTVDNLVMFTPPTVIGTLNGGVMMDKIEVNFEQGQLYATENNLDFGIKGKGFFVIETDGGMRYTRDGSLKLNADNELVTNEGDYVLGENGRVIIEGANFSVTKNGEIVVDEEVIDKLEIVNIANLRDLRKVGDELYRIEDNMQVETEPFTGEVVQGFLEGSNVDSMKEMIEMISLFRNYESSQKVVKAYDDSLGRAVNDIGKV